MVLVERGKLGLALQCLERAAALAPQQDYVHRHLAIVRARHNLLPPEQRDTEVFDDSFWSPGPNDEFNPTDPLTEQYLPQGQPVYLNRAHASSQMTRPETIDNPIVNLNGPPKNARVLASEQTENSLREQTVPELTKIVEPTSDTVFDKIISTDATELEIAQKHDKKIVDKEQFNRSTSMQNKESVIS